MSARAAQTAPNTLEKPCLVTHTSLFAPSFCRLLSRVCCCCAAVPWWHAHGHIACRHEQHRRLHRLLNWDRLRRWLGGGNTLPARHDLERVWTGDVQPARDGAPIRGPLSRELRAQLHAGCKLQEVVFWLPYFGSCSKGQFQRDQGKTSCEYCEPGRYCKEGTAEPIPCPGGFIGNATGLFSEGQCTPVQRGFWAPLGSFTPEPCPASGFYCPGQQQDEVNGGEKPVIMPVGTSTETQEVEVVKQQMTLDLTIDDFAAQREALIQKLAAQYGVDPSLITLEASVARRVRERRLQGGGIEITVTIATSDGKGNAVDIETIEARVHAVDDTALATTIGEIVGKEVTVVSAPPQRGSLEIEVPFSCPKGHWCTAGSYSSAARR